MVLHLHHVPGRLRVCLASLKGNPRAVPSLHCELLSIPGVESASLSPHTGSVTVLYQRDRFDVGTFWVKLRELGYLDAPYVEPASVSPMKEAALSSAASALGEALVSATIKHLVDRSAFSLIKMLT